MEHFQLQDNREEVLSLSYCSISIIILLSSSDDDEEEEGWCGAFLRSSRCSISIIVLLSSSDDDDEEGGRCGAFLRSSSGCIIDVRRGRGLFFFFFFLLSRTWDMKLIVIEIRIVKISRHALWFLSTFRFWVMKIISLMQNSDIEFCFELNG